MTPSVRRGYILGLLLAIIAIVLAACSKPAPTVKPEEIEGSVLLKNFDARRDIKTPPGNIDDFLARLGRPKSVKTDADDISVVTWYYRRYNYTDELGEYVSYEARFDRAGVFTGVDGKQSGTLNLDGFLKKNLTPEEHGTAPLPKGAPAANTETTTTIKPFDYKRVGFEEFFGTDIASPPLTLEIPKDYVRAVGFTSSGPAWMSNQVVPSVWLPPGAAATAVASHHLPETGGFIHGERAPQPVAGYSPYNGKFQNEDDLEAYVARSHSTLLGQKRLLVKGHPILAYLSRSPYGKAVGCLWIATDKESVVLSIIYRPADSDNLATVRATWDHILNSLQ